MSCENIHNSPADPVLVGASSMTKCSMSTKIYENVPGAASHGESQCMVIDESSRPFVIPVSEAQERGVTPKYLFSLNCVLKTEFLQDDKFKKHFNYMEK